MLQLTLLNNTTQSTSSISYCTRQYTLPFTSRGREEILIESVQYTFHELDDMYVCMVITCSKRMDQPGKVANPALVVS